MTDFLVQYFIDIMSALGYAGLTLLMALESMVAPVPSEAVMPFAGFLWFAGKMSFWPIVVFSTLGTIIGAVLSYIIGFYGGRPFIRRFGKYLLLNEEHLAATERFFARFGEKSIFISRFVPVVRHLISIPAGIGKMNVAKFCVYTILGGGIWNTFLAVVGYYLGSRWEEIRKYSEVLDIVFVVLIVAVVSYFVHKRRNVLLNQKRNLL